VILSSTKLYDVCNPVERGKWLDILIGLIEYLRSGDSRVGFLNNSVERNMLHKDQGNDLETVVVQEGVSSDGVEEVMASKTGLSLC
jgi:hypothetical protein